MPLGLSSRSIRFRNECAVVSAPLLVPHPTCTFPKKFCHSERALLPLHLDTIHPSVLPMAIALNPPSIFMRAISFAPKKNQHLELILRLRRLGSLPSPMRFISLISDFRKLSLALPFDLLTRSLKNEDLLLIRSERTLSLCVGRTRLRKNFELFGIWSCKFSSLRVLRQQFLIVIN